MYMVFNFSDKMQDYALKVYENGEYEEILNSDKDIYGGSNCLNNNLTSSSYKLNLKIAPLSCSVIKRCR